MTDQTMKRIEPGIYSRGGKFVADLSYKGVDGKYHRRRVTCRTITEARRERRRLENRKDARVKFDAIQKRLGPFIDEDWLPWVKRRTEFGADDPDRMAPLTYRRYAMVARLHIVPALGDVRLGDLTPDVIFGWMETLPRGQSRYYLTVLSSALQHATKRLRLLQFNPAHAVERPRMHKVEPKVLTIAERRMLEQATAGTRLEPALLLGLHGLRISEVVALRWEDLELDGNDGGTTHVRRQRWNTYPKDHSIRDIPIDAGTVATLRRLRKVQTEELLAKGRRASTIIATDEGGQMSTQRLDDLFRTLVRTTGLHLSFHALRHTFVSDLLHGGIDVATIAKLSGHRDASMILSVYGHGTTDSTTDAMQRLGAYRRGS